MPLKAAMEMTGTIPSGTMRLPMVEADATEREVRQAGARGTSA